jgi:hypothetical protein
VQQILWHGISLSGALLVVLSDRCPDSVCCVSNRLLVIGLEGRMRDVKLPQR